MILETDGHLNPWRYNS